MPTKAELLAAANLLLSHINALPNDQTAPTGPDPFPPYTPIPPAAPQPNLLPTPLRDGVVETNWNKESFQLTLPVGIVTFEADVQKNSTTHFAVYWRGVKVGGASATGAVKFTFEVTAGQESGEFKLGANGSGAGGVNAIVWSNGVLYTGTTKPGAVAPPTYVTKPVPSGVEPEIWVNVSSAEFGNGIGMNTNYVYAGNTWLTNLFNLFPWHGIRFPFNAYRLFDQTTEQLRTRDLNELKRVVNHVTNVLGKKICLDMHDYARFNDDAGTDIGVIGESPNAPVAAFAERWRKLAMEFRANPKVSFCLMNEPHDQNTPIWIKSAQAALDAVRSTGASNLIMVPGGGWTGAHSWMAGNALYFESDPIRDPANNWCYDMHQYFDSNASGTSSQVTPGKADTIIAPAQWCASRGERMFIGEWAFADSPEGHAEAEKFLDNLAAFGRDHIIGSAYWASGPWWPGNWNIVGPDKGNGQFATLLPHHVA